MENSVLYIENLSKRFKTKLAVDNVSLDLKAGEILGLVGRNGAGKTTLMKMVTGLCRPTSGRIELFGSAFELEKKRHRLGTIVETPCFFNDLNALKNLEYFRQQRGIQIDGCIEQILKTVHLWEDRQKAFKAYSLGMKQRLGLALALLGQPDLLILDEPINGIDPEGIAELRQILHHLVQERHIAILISSHILAELQHVASRFAIMDEGRILSQISAQNLAEETSERLVVSVDEPERALALLQTRFPDLGLRVNEQAQILLPRQFSEVPELIAYLVGEGFRLHAVEHQGISLEDYFLKSIRH